MRRKSVQRLKKNSSIKALCKFLKLEKIVVSQGIGAATADKKLIDNSITELTTITGQQAVPTKSKKDISNFKLRKGMPIGARVTLRDNNMYEFLDRLIAVSLPRIRDFRGINDKGFDGHGNYNLGITEQIIFPEINIDKINKIQGMDITFVTSAKNDIEALELLKQFGLPFKNQNSNNNG
ncbi:50S ribosomal protein L5 [Sphingobacterium daejeonense]|uniref:50S ribosomal protein L5 n=1 Tax=Sphingobacterium daejeonense TaxID=371142 RepID=UPI0010C39A63|nr:50S ribosomal protein L5 [Sphingobacterium daejeonense]VTQ05474.1 50S ribosomal protein L5 [Sphingobacterium daejeonense]